MEARSNAPEYPDWIARTSFALRSRGLQAQRLAQNALRRLPLLTKGAVEDFPYVLAESVSPLHTTGDPRERLLMLGKIQNLRLACRRLHHRVLAPRQTFSLWRQIGPPWRLRGFVHGREVREGCVIPTFGGGLCQLSGSLLKVALGLDLELFERHSHSVLPEDLSRNPHRDATLFWNYVDLRFRSPIAVLCECFLTETALVVRLRAKTPRTANAKFKTAEEVKTDSQLQTRIESCFTCNQKQCSRHIPATFENRKIAFLLDDYQPEFARFLRERMKDGDQILVPFVSPHGWNSSRIGGDVDLCFPTSYRLRRSLTLRWSAFRNITVARAYFDLGSTLADFYEQRLDYHVEHLCVAQNLLPHLWRSGALGGRTFEVLMQRLPVTLLERQLNHAAELYPHSTTLIEFRAPTWFGLVEEQALQAARTIFTPHSQIAALYDRTARLSWETPVHQNGHNTTKDILVFLGPTLARKGAYAVRDAVRKTRLPLTVLGGDLEEPSFWRDLPVKRIDVQELQWERVHTVIQPALIEYWPRQFATSSRRRRESGDFTFLRD